MACLLKRARTLYRQERENTAPEIRVQKVLITRCMIENFQYIGSTLNEMFTSDVEIKKILCHCERASGKTEQIVNTTNISCV